MKFYYPAFQKPQFTGPAKKKQGPLGTPSSQYRHLNTARIRVARRQLTNTANYQLKQMSFANGQHRKSKDLERWEHRVAAMGTERERPGAYAGQWSVDSWLQVLWLAEWGRTETLPGWATISDATRQRNSCSKRPLLPPLPSFTTEDTRPFILPSMTHWCCPVLCQMKELVSCICHRLHLEHPFLITCAFCIAYNATIHNHLSNLCHQNSFPFKKQVSRVRDSF